MVYQQQNFDEMAASIPMSYGDHRIVVAFPAQNNLLNPINEFDTISPSNFTESYLTGSNTTPASFSSPEFSAPELDYEILNGVSGLEDLVFGADFQLFPAEVDYDSYAGSLFPDSQATDPSFGNDQVTLERDTAKITSPNNACTVYNCSHCPRVFQKRHELNRHLLRHNRPYSCSVVGCGQSFAEKRGRDRHMQARHGPIDKIKCRYCEYSSTRSDAVQRHLKSRHGVHVSFHGGVSAATTSKSQG